MSNAWSDVHGPGEMRIPIAVSARHAHLSAATLRQLFGERHELHVLRPLSQTGQFSAQETVSLVGPRGRLDHVRLMGPPRHQDQIELSRSDEHALGIAAPLRVSGDVANTPGLQVIGPAGTVTLPSGVITARRHIHMSPKDALQLRVHDGQNVSVRIDSDGRDLIFGDIVVRVAPDFRLELHLDTDEANAAGVSDGGYAELVARSA
jgi:propanediol utilization protein